jgi:hypothetical protein
MFDDRSKNFLIDENFIDVIIEDLKLSQQKCKHCDHQITKSAVREQQHLKICEAFKQEQKRKKETNFSKNTVQLLIISLCESTSIRGTRRSITSVLESVMNNVSLLAAVIYM